MTDLSTLLRLQEAKGGTQTTTLADVIKASSGDGTQVLGGDGALHAGYTAPAGLSGTFTVAGIGTKTITIVNGIITSIA
jgi:hypothetical protein